MERKDSLARKEIFKEEPREVIEVESKDLKLSSVLEMLEGRMKRDGEVLSVVCDDQASQ